MPDEAAGEEPGQADEVPWGVSVLDAFTVFPEAFSSHPSCPLLLLGAQDCGTFLIVLRFLFMHVSSGTSCFGGDLLSKSLHGGSHGIRFSTIGNPTSHPKKLRLKEVEHRAQGLTSSKPGGQVSSPCPRALLFTTCFLLEIRHQMRTFSSNKLARIKTHLPCGEARVDLPSGCCWGTNKARPRGRHLPA